jgi:hypothetical protein
VLILRLHDAERRPPDWTDLVRPGQFVTFAKLAAGGTACDADGRPFSSPGTATCIVFDRLDEAQRFCERQTALHSSIQFDIFDAEGRVNPPLLTIVHASRQGQSEAHPGTIKRRTRIAVALILVAVPLLGFGWYIFGEPRSIFPIVIGVNLLVAASRLLLMNLGAKEAERIRQQRVLESGQPARDDSASPQPSHR